MDFSISGAPERPPVSPLCWRRQRFGAVDGGVGDDQAGEPVLRERDFGDVGDGLVVEVGRDFQEDGAVLDDGVHLAGGYADAAEQFLQRAAILQAAQAGRVGRGDVDRDVGAVAARRLCTPAT